MTNIKKIDLIGQDAQKMVQRSMEENLNLLEEMGIVSAEEVVKKADDEITYMIKDILPMEGPAMLVGSSSTGKSRLANQIAMSVVSGKDCLGKPMIKVKDAHALIISTEDGIKASGTLMKKQNKALSLTEEELSRIHYLFDSSDMLSKIEQYLMTYRDKTVMIVKDTFSDDFSGDIYKTNEVRTYIQNICNLLCKYPFTDDEGKEHTPMILFVHHTGKRTDELAPSKHNILGSQGLESKSRTVMELKINLSDESTRYLAIVKGNYLSPEQKSNALVLDFSEDLVFENTGNVIAFDDINKDTKRKGEQAQRYHDIMEMRKARKTWKQIAEHFCMSISGVVSFIERYEKANGDKK